MQGRLIYTFIVLVPIFLIIIFTIIISYDNFKTLKNISTKYSTQFEKDFFNKYKNIIYNNVHNIVQIINFEQKQIENNLKDDLLDKLNNARDIAQKIYDKNKDKLSKKEIRELVVNHLSLIRFYNNRGYFHILDFSTNKMLGHPMKKFLGKDFSDKKDIRGTKIVKLQKDALKNKEIAFVELYFHKPSDQENEYKKLVITTKFEPLNLLIGTGEYFDVIENKVKYKVLKEVEILNKGYGDEYSFIMEVSDLDNHNMKLKRLHSLAKGYLDQDYIKIDKQFLFLNDVINDIRKSKESYQRYYFSDKNSIKKQEKYSYFYYHKKWNWIIGSGFYFNKYDTQLKELKAKKEKILYDHLVNSFIFTIVAVVLILSILYFLMKLFNKKFISHVDAINEANKSKSQFLANMSHEIRTPLNAILGFVNILKDSEKDKEKLKYLNTINDSSKTLLGVINDILDLSKIESGKLDIDKIDFNPKKEFEVLLHLFDAQSKQKNISLILNIDSNIPSIINSDPLRIKQIISNLLSNAIKFTKDGKKVLVDINYKNKLLNISIKDEGIGIAKDKLNHIFEPFNQEDSSTTRRFGGTGLGLSISRELINLLGGELKVKSEIGIGSEFYFSIPISIGKESKEQISNSIKESSDFSNIKLLLVEDNKANQMFMKITFKKMNILFDIANDGIEAIDMFKNNTYDIIFMDENMPNMNGIEATKNILEIENRLNLKHTPIVALTANALKGDRERFLEAGMDEYMSKPLDKKELNYILNKLVN